jgi:hypothetical protein
MSTGGNEAFFAAHARGLAALVKLRPIPSSGQEGPKFRIFVFITTQMVREGLFFMSVGSLTVIDGS